MFEEQSELIEEMRKQTEISKLKLNQTMQTHVSCTNGRYESSYKKYTIEGGVSSPSSSLKIRFLCAVLLGLLAWNMKNSSYGKEIEYVVEKIGSYKTIEDVTERVEVFLQNNSKNKIDEKE